MRAPLLAAVLLGVGVLVPFARAQRDYRPSLHFTVLGAEGHTYLTADGVATDANGTLYVGNLSQSAIRKFLPDGTEVTLNAFVLSASEERVPARFNGSYPNRIAADPEGNLYVAAHRSVCKITPDGATTLLADDLGSARGIAADAGGNLYIADSDRHAICKISRDGIVTTFAGKSGESGHSDGTASARFFRPTGVAVDSSGTVFVADNGNGAIRKITPDGVVSTLARGAVHAGTAATWGSVSGLAVDLFGTVYAAAADYGIYQIAPGGAVSAIGLSGGFGDRIEAGFLDTITVDRNGVIYALDGWYGAVLMSAAPPNFTAPLASQSVPPGGTATFGAVAIGAAPITYQWRKEGVAIPGATTATLTIGNAQVKDLGGYSVRITNAVGSVVSNPATLAFLDEGGDGLANPSIRGHAGPGAQSLIVGFIVGGANTANSSTSLLVRGVGPTLGTYGVAGSLADPRLSVFSGATVVSSNDNWNGDNPVSAIGTRVGAFPFAATTSRDAALYLAGLRAGACTVQLSGAGGTTGAALVEIYDATTPNGSATSAPRLINLSARTQVGAGADIFSARFTLRGTTTKTLLLRAVGPTLEHFGVSGALADPRLDLYSDSTLVHSNDDWGDHHSLVTAAASVGAFALDGASRDAALLVTLGPGNYTVQVSGAGRTTGIALVEIYEVP